MSLRPLGAPRPVRVECDEEGVPVAVAVGGGRLRAVTDVRDDWLVQEGWWTGRAVERRYFELVLDTGRLLMVFQDDGGAWHVHS